MIKELTNLIDNFPGPANQTQCFLHILNLVVKSIIQQFDIPTSKKDTEDNDGMDEATNELLKLADDIDLEEELTVSTGDKDDTIDDDNNEGWIDEHEEMTEQQLFELEESVQLVRLLLTKVC